MFRSLVALITAVCLVACTSLRPIPSTDAGQVHAAVKVGDEVRVEAINGKTYLLVLTVVDDEKIVGVGDNQKVTIRYAQIKSIQVQKINVGKTAGLTAGVVGGILLTAVVVFTIIVVRGLNSLE